MYPLLRLALTWTFLGLCFAAIGHAGQPAAGAPPGRESAPASDAARLIPATGRPIELEVNKGTLVRLARPANTVFVADPDIADVQVKSPTLVYISAKAPGETVIYAVDASDSVLMNASILVEHDISRLRSSLQQLAPCEQVSAASVDGNLTATFLAIKSVLPGMKERRTGCIITMSSSAGRRAHPRSPIPYAAAKAGIELMTQDVAAQAGPLRGLLRTLLNDDNAEVRQNASRALERIR